MQDLFRWVERWQMEKRAIQDLFRNEARSDQMIQV